MRPRREDTPLSPAAGAPAIRLTRATKRFGRTLAVDAVSFEVTHGEVLGFLGPNGAGKTTAMRMVMGLLHPTDGIAEIVGHRAHPRDSARYSRVGYLPGVLELPAAWTGRQYVRYTSRIRRRDCGRRATELADRLGLDLGRRIGELSKGNRQKLGIVQALMHEPEVLVLDEPTSGLDPLAHREVERLLRELRAAGAAVLLSSHVMSEVENLADRVAIIDRGRLAIIEAIGVLKQRALRRIDLTFERPVDASRFASLDAVVSAEALGDRVLCSVSGSENGLLRLAVELGVVSVTSLEPRLEDIFLSLVDGGRAA